MGMTTETLSPPTLSAVSPAESESVAPNRVVISGVSWNQYEAFGKLFPDHQIRATFDGERLELMTTSYEHENLSGILAQLVQFFCSELRIPRKSAGSTTFQRKDLQRGIEPDKCFYLGNIDWLLEKNEIDLNVDPPPDLAIEVEVSRSMLDRIGIYATLGVPEIWRVDRDQFWILQRTIEGEYRESPVSRYFPKIPGAKILELARQGRKQDETAFEQEVRDWLRERLASNRQTDS
jgi:Uma2 family endonuclease